MKYFVRTLRFILFMYNTALTLSIAGEKTPIYINDIEVRILFCLSQGLVLKQIADLENLAYDAIKDHMSSLYKKSRLKLHTPAALVGWLAEHNFYHTIKEQIKPGLEKEIEKLRQKAAY